jgi:hypothetical protein
MAREVRLTHSWTAFGKFLTTQVTGSAAGDTATHPSPDAVSERLAALALRPAGYAARFSGAGTRRSHASAWRDYASWLCRCRTRAAVR